MTVHSSAPLLFVFFASLAAHAHAAPAAPSFVPQETCVVALRELDAVRAHLVEAQPARSAQALPSDRHQVLALELDSHLDALRASLPVAGTPRAQASLLLSDMRDGLSLMRSAQHADARQLAAQRIEADYRLYNALLKTLGCTTSQPTAL